jgi:hypothetical protein
VLDGKLKVGMEKAYTQACVAKIVYEANVDIAIWT